MSRAEFADRFGRPDVRGALCGYTREDDTRAVLALLCHARPRRVLEIGTALGHMTANLTRWTDEEARVFTVDLVQGMPRTAPGAAEQQVEVPGHAASPAVLGFPFTAPIVRARYRPPSRFARAALPSSRTIPFTRLRADHDFELLRDAGLRP